MSQDRNRAAVLFAGVLVVSALTGAAHGYLDPGSWSYLWQLLIGGMLGGLFAVKLYWTKIKAFFYSHFAKAKDEPKQDDK